MYNVSKYTTTKKLDESRRQACRFGRFSLLLVLLRAVVLIQIEVVVGRIIASLAIIFPCGNVCGVAAMLSGVLIASIDAGNPG